MSEPITVPAGVSVHTYVDAVRAHLTDLPADDIDDLIGGLEADLAERAAELPPGSDPAAAFGSPLAYAAELRAAAGFPPAAPPRPAPRPGTARRFEEWLRATGAEVAGRWTWLADLRPVWWVVRGAVLGGLIGVTVLAGTSRFVAVFVAGVGMLVSFWWGRTARRAIGSAGNRATVAANVVAALLLLPMTAAYLTPSVVYVDTGSAAASNPGAGASGTWVNGEPATNLYAYDADGNRIDRVRLYNQFGQSVSVGAEGTSWLRDLQPDQQPALDPKGEWLLNREVFPLRWGTRTGWEPSNGRWEPPVKISALPAPSASSSGASPGASPGASRGAPPGPGSSASTSPGPASSHSPQASPAVSPSPSP